jgi:hypothetical protein
VIGLSSAVNSRWGLKVANLCEACRRRLSNSIGATPALPLT